MCGITGIYNKSGIKIEDLIQMNLIIKHRGPDDEGYFFATNNQETKIFAGEDSDIQILNAALPYTPKEYIKDFESNQNFSLGLAHRRLSILDLSPKGHMPLCDDQERYWISYNGEVYNFIEIRKELEENGFQFNTETDTEVIVVAYKFWGIACLDKFVGMFSFVIYDKIKNELFLVRDRYGIKPLYYWISPDKSFHFGSEIKQFTVCKDWKAVLNHQRAYDYLYYALTDHTDETLFKGVFQILPGHAISINLNTFDFNENIKLPTHKWYNPEKTKFKGSFDDAKAQFKKLFINSVDLHLRSDVPVGSALSGGLDSSSIVCVTNLLLKERGSKTSQNTFSSIHDNGKYSEKQWVDEVIKHTNVTPHFVYPTFEKLITYLPSLIWYMDEPYQSQSAFLAYRVFMKVKQNKITVLLNGQGADEYLSGYGEFKILYLKNLLIKGKFSEFKKVVQLPFFSSIGYGMKLIIQSCYSLFKGKTRFYIASKSLSYKALSKVIDLKILHIKNAHPKDSFEHDSNTQEGISKYQLFSNPLPRYLRWEDRNSMAHSIESRVPFLDHRLVEFCHSLPVEYLVDKDSPKPLLSEAMDGILPDKIKNRKDKKGYITPEEQWVRYENSKDFRKMLEESINNSKGILTTAALDYFDAIVEGTIPFDYTYWRLILFGVWMKEFKIEI